MEASEMWAKMNLSSFKLWVLDIVSSDEKVTKWTEGSEWNDKYLKW